MIKLLLWLALIVVTPWAAGAEDELLEPDAAYRFSAAVRDANTVQAKWDIADGYYMYRNKFRFQTATPGVTLGEPVMPKGKIKKDEFFGEMEVYRHRVVIDIPVTRAAGAPREIELTATSQGCADLGVCYPPHTQTARLTLPAAAPARADKGSALKALTSLGDSLGLGGGAEEFLEPDKAFALDTEVLNANTVAARWQIADNYYMYRDKVVVKLVEGDGVSLGPIQLPPGKEKNDEFFGKMQVYVHNAEVRIPLQRSVPGAGLVKLQFTYQGCADAGICYPPITKAVALELPAAAVAAPSQSAIGTTATPTGEQPLSEQDSIAHTLATEGTLLVMLTFFGFGLLLSLTPCVFPMIPILSSIVVGQGETLTTRRAFVMSLVYVLAMAVTYTTAGVLAGMFGSNLQAAFQDPWILGSFAAVFALLALSMFGFYELQLPSSLQSKLTELSNRQQGGTLIGVGIMGFLSALIVGPCVAPPLAGALIYIGQSGDALLGGLALFAMSMGMGTPLLAIGTSAGKILPKAGDWMNAIKAVFGVLLLAVAVWMLERILPAEITMTLWAVLLIISAVYMGALQSLGLDATGWSKLWKGIGLVLLVYGVLLLVGMAGGGRDVLQPLHGFGMARSMPGPATAATQQARHPEFKTVKGLDGLNGALAAAQGKPVLLDFYADWCVECIRLERNTFSDPAVQRVLADAVLLRADVTANDALDKALLKQLKLIGPPAILFFGPDGQERSGQRLIGYYPPAEFIPRVQRALR